MSILGTIGYGEPTPVLRGARVLLRMPSMADHSDWAALREASRGFLTPWEPTWPADDLARAAFRRRLRRYQREVRSDTGYPFFVFRQDTQEIVGGLTLSNVRRGVTQCCSLGYWVGEPHARRGYMSEAVSTVLPFAFGALGLHRVEAACLPHNAASVGLLRRCGFSQEGYARSYLRIAGAWRDHLLFARLSDDPPPSPQAADPLQFAAEPLGAETKHSL